ncbi:capsule biosynthesis GfcC family protein [Enterovibrio sp. ZSDZ42]|uniref:Capsule biosynthesis GfcC family protein n=1 Tax=Enterovibrio gelatinilyticus TaxID=2899819 RepID=A0ABT5R7S1_9GAMM|nr:capsule biosynthesis GfcC family protein [Enterovibrio sp. ZSDZ42]MDD1796049.1 capsule biosynthesis GfcC family protein [Enterovibrio sp. ZSDZ42]
MPFVIRLTHSANALFPSRLLQMVLLTFSTTALLFSTVINASELASTPPKEQTQTRVTVINATKDTRHFSVTFDGSPRASQVISQGALLARQHAANIQGHNSDPIFWQGAGLFSDSDNNDVENLRTQVLEALSLLETEWRDDHAALNAVESLVAFLSESTFKQRVAIAVDEDVYLAGGRINPLLAGDLTLLLPSRPKNVWVLGAVKQTADLDFSPLKLAGDYADVADTLDMFGTSEVDVIQPDGHQETHKVAYWNEVPRNLAPGALIYVPFSGLPSELSSLNHLIPTLLQHRVM